MRVMEKKLVIELCVCGYYAYKNIWEAAIREELRVNENLGTLRTDVP